MSALRTKLSVLLILLLLSISAVAGTVIHVPADQPTIQAGIDAAFDGDTVLVSPGTYYENISLNGKAITVTSANGPVVTVIDGSTNYDSTVIFYGGETTASVLSGFTIQNSNNSDISISGSNPTVTSNIIQGNSQNYTSGIQVQSGSGVILAGC